MAVRSLGTAGTGEATLGIRTFLRGTVAAGVGNALEFYAFAVHSFLTPVLAVVFFLSKNVLVGLLSAVAVFAAGFGIRPLGGILFGILADRRRRRTAIGCGQGCPTMARAARGPPLGAIIHAPQGVH
jgi:MFS family permease